MPSTKRERRNYDGLLRNTNGKQHPCIHMCIYIYIHVYIHDDNEDDEDDDDDGAHDIE